MNHAMDMFSEMCRIMAEMGEEAGFEHFQRAAWRPPVDIYERENTILVVMEIPGIDRNDLHVSVAKGVLKITGFKPKHTPDAAQRVHLMEIPYGRFARFVRVPRCADVESIEANYKDGFLTIEIPREAGK